MSEHSAQKWWLSDTKHLTTMVHSCMKEWYKTDAPLVAFVANKEEFKAVAFHNGHTWLFSADLEITLDGKCCPLNGMECECEALRTGLTCFAFQAKPSESLTESINELHDYKGEKRVTRMICYSSIEDSKTEDKRTGIASCMFFYDPDQRKNQ